jgi:maltose alpha-D-glucosyltransferase/alpha-amylase
MTNNDKLTWYKDAIIYELHIKAFCDGNGDGTGDFAGLLEKLDYLENLGITAIWLLPFYPSPLRDDGYDIADYYNINPSYGNIEQLRQLIQEAHKRNLKVITELVINHTSDQHPWFQRARRAPVGSVERDYYVWSDDPTRYKDVRIIFQDYEASNWSWDPVAGQYYWHRFFHHQPDLNYDNPQVQEEVFRIIDYWCDMGVDGFRLDAVPYLFEREGTNGENLPETHAFLKKLRKHVDDHHPATVFLAEANMWPEDSASYFGEGDECHMNYHFPVMPRIFMALRMEDRYPITDIFDQTPEIPGNCQWAIFLRNHDELTLEMVTDEERDYMYKVYVKDPKARINLGIRHRLAPLMENNTRKIELLNCLLFSLRGTPVIYYGDEIGMGDNFYLGDRDGVRTPMQWSPDRNAGFSRANPQKLYLPLILDPEYHYESVNVETQFHNPSSLLWFMKRMIRMRKKHKAFGRGDMKFINVDNPKVLAFTRTYEDETLLVIVNLSRYTQAAEMDLSSYNGYLLRELFSKNQFPVVKESTPYFFTLGSYAYEWFLLEKVHAEPLVTSDLPLIEVAEWKELANRDLAEYITNTILPQYLKKTHWYLGRERIIDFITVLNHAEIKTGDHTAYLLLIEVNYESGLPEIYQLPFILLKQEDSMSLLQEHPAAAICRVKRGDTERILADALYTPAYRAALMHLMAEEAVMNRGDSSLVFKGSEPLRRYLEESHDQRSRVVSVQFSYTSIAYDTYFFLKAYRHVERMPDPDAEMTAYLTFNHDAPFIPPVMGSIEWRTGSERITLGMLQVLVEYHGNGNTYMAERLNNINEKVLTRNPHQLPAIELHGSLVDPVAYEELPDHLLEFLGAPLAEGSRMLGTRTAHMHMMLASATDNKDFAPENFSLHYQRSLFAGMQTLVRTSFDKLQKKLNLLPPGLIPEAEHLLRRRAELLGIFKKIYGKKFDITRMRIHGYYTLDQVLFTGKDVAIHYLGGDPNRSFGERRIKRSPIRDLASMIRSFHYAAQTALKNGNISVEESERLVPYYRLWTHYVSAFFMSSYLKALGRAPFIPDNREDFSLLLKIYLLEIATQNLNYELDHGMHWIVRPLRLMKVIMDEG